MRRHLPLAAAAFALAALLSGCAGAPAPVASAPALGSDRILPYVHVDGFGTETDEAAWIAWEFEAQAFVKYQVAFTSCTCRPESINERSLLYIEVAKSEKGGKIRKLWYEYWGDSPKFPSGSDRKQVESEFVPLFPNKKLDTLDKIDTIAGATVTTVNLKQIAKAVLAYHNAKYPAPGVPEPADFVDATSSATE